jgi:hypothetical protein
MLFFQNIASWCVLDRRVGSAADSRRRHSLSGTGLKPFGPIAPPAALALFRASQPRRRRPGRRRIAGLVGPVAAFACGRRVDHAGDVPTRCKHTWISKSNCSALKRKRKARQRCRAFSVLSAPAALAEVAELERSKLVQNRPSSPAEVRHASNRNEGSRL